MMLLPNKTEQEKRVWGSFVGRFSLTDRQQEQFLSYLNPSDCDCEDCHWCQTLLFGTSTINTQQKKLLLLLWLRMSTLPMDLVMCKIPVQNDSMCRPLRRLVYLPTVVSTEISSLV